MTTNPNAAAYVNKFAVGLSGPNARIIFADERAKAAGGLKREVAEIVMTIENLKQLGELIQGLIVKNAPARKN